MDQKIKLNTIEEAIEDYKAGKFIIVEIGRAHV